MPPINKKILGIVLGAFIFLSLIAFAAQPRNNTSQDAIDRLALGQDLETVQSILRECNEDFTTTIEPNGNASIYFGGKNFIVNLLSEQTFYCIQVNPEIGLKSLYSERCWLNDEHSYETLLETRY